MTTKNTDTGTDTSSYGRQPWDVLRDAGHHDAADQLDPNTTDDEDEEEGCVGGACSLVTDPDGSPDHPDTGVVE